MSGARIVIHGADERVDVIGECCYQWLEGAVVGPELVEDVSPPVAAEPLGGDHELRAGERVAKPSGVVR